MKSLRYFLINVVLLTVVYDACACGPHWYTPSGYHLFRICEPQSGVAANGAYPNSARNCEEWQKLTSDDIPVDDIYDVVYRMSWDEFRTIADNTKVSYDNSFIEWITKKDTAILDFLLLAKTNEYIRIKLNSRWYYPTMKTGVDMTIEEVAEKALAQTDERLRDRYLLQAVRALFSMSKFEECVRLWEDEVALLPEENLMRQMIMPYIAGAEYRLNHSEKALEYFARLGDVNSMLFCLGRGNEEISTVDALEMVCKYAPNSKYVLETLQSYIRFYELDSEFVPGCDWTNNWGYEKRMTEQDRRVISICLAAAVHRETENPAMWYYAAAFVYEQAGDLTNASKLLDRAEKSKSSDFIDESIKVLRIYIDAQQQPYNSAYENKLYHQLEWLDAKICESMTEDVREGVVPEHTDNPEYWNKAMRKILLAEVCPRMIKEGKTTRALQLANMADNRQLGLVDRVVCDYYDSDDIYSMSAYRYSAEYFNGYDYSNHFFEMIDTLGVDVVAEYVNNVWHSESGFDKFLNERGYTNSDYLNDILGTQYLRNMRYGDALEHFGRISDAYKHHHNLYIEYDPFCAARKYIGHKDDFKYDFAREMHSLEQEIAGVADPNRKGRLMMKLAIGIRSSFDFCWPLTQYYCGEVYYGQVCEKRDWVRDEYTQAATTRVEQLLQTAFDIVTDDEVAAEMHYELYNFETVATKYPNTDMGELVKGSCDYLYDHDPLSRRYSCCRGYSWW